MSLYFVFRRISFLAELPADKTFLRVLSNLMDILRVYIEIEFSWATLGISASDRYIYTVRPLLLNTLRIPRANFTGFEPLLYEHLFILNVNAFLWSQLYVMTLSM